MGKAKANLKVPIYSRLFITFLIIMIPIYGIGLSIYYWGFGAIHKEISTSMLSKEKFIMDKLEAETQKLEILQGNCLKDRNVVNLVNISEIMTDEEKYQAFTSVANKLNTIYLSSSLIKDVILYLPTIQKQYSTFKDGTEAINEEKYEMLKTLHQNSGSEFIFQEKGIYLINMYPPEYLHKTQDISGVGPQCMLEIEFSKNLLLESFKQLNTYKGSGFLLLNTTNGYKIAGSSNGKISDAIYQSMKNTFNEAKNNIVSVDIDGVRYITLYTSSDYLKLSILRYIPEDEVYKQLDFYSLLLWIFLAISIFIIIIYSISTYNFIQIPLKKLIKSFKQVGKGDLKVSIEHMHNDEFNYLYQRFNEMVERIDFLINQTYKQKILLQKSELKQLQTQINPHFLYNSFFILERMIKSKDFESSLELVDHLGNYFQFITRNASDEIQLEKEVFHARTYSEIQSVRFGDRIQINFEEFPVQYADLKVPRLILQPLVENAIVHGFKDKESDGIINISYMNNENKLYITIDDNGSGMDDDKLMKLIETLDMHDAEIESTAVINIHNRIRMTFGNGSGLVLQKNRLDGLSLSIVIELPDTV